MKSARRIATLARRHIKEMVREPMGLVFLFGMPLVMEVLFYFLFSKQTGQFAMAYLAPAMVGFAHAFLALFLGMLLSVDRGSAMMVRLYTTEVRPVEFILSYTVATLPLGMAQAALLLLVAGICDPAFWSVHFLSCLGASVVTALFYIVLGLLLGTLCKEKAVGGVASIVVTGQSILSGMWFPLEGMSKGFNTFLTVLPFRNASLVLQNVFFDRSFAGIGQPILILAAYTLAVGIAAVLLFYKKMQEQ